MKKLFKRFKTFVRPVFHNYFPKLLYTRFAFSGDGEDLILASFYEQKKNYKGFYVDVGAHHPFRFSNTAYFYKRGWSGINIEATPSLMKAFKMYRKRDINLNLAIGEGEMMFNVFNEHGINSFDDELSQSRLSDKYKIVDRKKMKLHPLAEVLNQYLPENKRIDLLTVDVEGLDLMVLKTNDWDKYKPEFIMVEGDIENNEISDFLTNLGYKNIARTMRTWMFRLPQ